MKSQLEKKPNPKNTLDRFLSDKKEEKSLVIKKKYKDFIIHPNLVNTGLRKLWNGLMRVACEVEKQQCIIPGCESLKVEDKTFKGYCERCYSVWHYCFGEPEDPKPTYLTPIEKQFLDRRKQKEKEKHQKRKA